MSDTVLIPLGPLGTLQLTREQFETALVPTQEGPVAARVSVERWLNSRELSTLTGIGDTTLEQLARQGTIPCIRAGKALRFVLSEVTAALRHADKRSSTQVQSLDRVKGKSLVT